MSDFGTSDQNIEQIRFDAIRRQAQAPDSWYRQLQTLNAKYDNLFGPNVEGSVNPNAAEFQLPLRPNASWAEIQDYVATWYGPGMVGFLNTHPDVRDVLLNAARTGEPYQNMYAKIQGTKWFQSTAQPAREFGQIEANDPATAASMVAETAAELRNQAESLGLGLSNQQIASMAWQIRRNGWNEFQTVDALLKGLNWKQVEPGDLTANLDAVKNVAGKYLVDVSESTAQQYAARIASGEMTLAAVQSIMRSQAKSRFSWMGSQIDQGVTPEDYFMPVRDVVARTLELNPEDINLMDPKWLSLVETRGPDGQIRGATMHEAMMDARQRPEFVNTQQASEMTTGLGSLLKRAFGY